MHRNGIVNGDTHERLSSMYSEAASVLYALIRSLSKKLQEEGSHRPYAIRDDVVMPMTHDP
jgi:hypothetical protein